MKLANVKRGDRIIVQERGHGLADEPRVSEWEVVSAGPKYVTASPDRMRQALRFHRDSGGVVTDYSVRIWAWPDMASFEAEEARARLVADVTCRLREFRAAAVSDETLRALLALLEAA